MLERRSREQFEFFLCGSLRDLVPDEHVLARVDRILDLSWLHDMVAESYAASVGRPAIDPEAALRLMLAGFLLGIVHDRRLIREAQVNRERDEHPTFPFAIAAARTAPSPIGAERDGRRSR